MAWPAKKHSDENAHETHRIMPRRWGEVLVPTHPIFGPGRKRLPHTCICVYVCVCVPVRIPAHAHDCIRSQHLFPSFDTCVAELEHRVLLSIVSCSHHTESNMYAGRIQYVGVCVPPLLLTMLDDKTYFCNTIPPFTLESLPSTVNNVLLRRSYGFQHSLPYFFKYTWLPTVTDVCWPSAIL